MRSRVRRIAISGLVALATVLGGAAIPATALARPTSGVRSMTAVAARAAGPARAAAEGGGSIFGGVPKVSCVSTADCVAVEGTSKLGDDGGTPVPTRVARWNGKSWKRVGVTLPAGTKSADLDAVSCRAATSCLVVGDYYKSASSGAPNFPLALIYNGTSLKPTPAVPLPKGAADVALADVSCATTRYCVAIGAAEPPPGIAESTTGPVILIETWNGARWTLRSIASSVKAQVEPSAVSCATAAFCVVAGELTAISGNNFSFGLYLGSWNGKTLTRMKGPAEGGASSVPEPVGVSCATRSNCGVAGIVLGDVTSGSKAPDVTAFTQVWNGKTWQAGKAARPKGAQSIFLGLSCFGARSCETVGEGAASATASSGYALAVSYRGAAGTVQAVPAPAKGRSTAFTAVSCLSGGTCVATGWTGKSNAATPSLMTGVWGGKSWKLDPGF
jgi:hypothetical protein